MSKQSLHQIQHLLVSLTSQTGRIRLQQLRGTDEPETGRNLDEILLEAPADRAEWAAKVLQQVMEQAGQQYLRKVPVKAEVAIVSNWVERY